MILMLRMCVYMHSRFVENHPIRILEDGPLISEGVLSQRQDEVLPEDEAETTISSCLYGKQV
jgi:hypothetical protein